VLPEATIGDDYVIRVETIGYIDKPAAEAKPKETVLRAIEVVAQPESTFYGKVNVGKHTLLVAGELLTAKTGGFHVHIHYVHSLDRGVTVPSRNGKPKRVLDTSSLQTNIAVSLGKPVTLGGLDTSIGTSDPQPRDTKSRIRYVLVFNKYKRRAIQKTQANKTLNRSGG
jgi:hypothetical protein